MQLNQKWIWQQHNWTNFTWRTADLSAALASARFAQGKVIGMARLLGADLSLEALSTILIEDGLTTSAIEGEHLDALAVRSSVAHHLGLSTLGLPVASRAVDGLVELLLDATRQYAQPLDLKRLCAWQGALFPTGQSGLHPVLVGQLRGFEPMRVISGSMGREVIHFEAPPKNVLDDELLAFLNGFNHPDESVDGLIRAGIAYLWFITLHPFEDGNGRIARAITDMALAQDDQQPMRLFSLSAQILKTREAYYNILEQTQRGDTDITAWLNWFLQQITAAAQQAEHTIAKTLTKARFWLTHQQTDLNERQRKVLNRMLDEKGDFQGGMNTRKYVSLAKTSRATAYRELMDSVDKKCLKPLEAAGRSSGYELVYEN